VGRRQDGMKPWECLFASFVELLDGCAPACCADVGWFSALAEGTGVPERGDGSSAIARCGRCTRDVSVKNLCFVRKDYEFSAVACSLHTPRDVYGMQLPCNGEGINEHVTTRTWRYGRFSQL
jgi:hypothetical protein